MLKSLVDSIYYSIFDVLPIVMLLCVLVGAGLLWRRTRRASVLAQFIGSALLFAGFGLFQIRWRTVTPYDHSVYADVLRSEPMEIGIWIAQLLGLTVFSVSYVWCALTQKRI